MTARVNPFQRRRFASQTKPLHACHPERELWISGRREILRYAQSLRLSRSEGMTKREGLVFEMDWPQGSLLLYYED